MTKELLERSRKRPAFVDVASIVTTTALVFSLLVAFSVVTIGIARADTLVPFGGSNMGRIALAMLLGVTIAGTGWLTAAMHK